MCIYPRIFRLPIKQFVFPIFSFLTSGKEQFWSGSTHQSGWEKNKMSKKTTAGDIAVLWTALLNLKRSGGVAHWVDLLTIWYLVSCEFEPHQRLLLFPCLELVGFRNGFSLIYTRLLLYSVWSIHVYSYIQFVLYTFTLIFSLIYTRLLLYSVCSIHVYSYIHLKLITFLPIFKSTSL